MSEWKIKNRGAKICMFWDVEDYPIPDGRDPCWMKWKIEKALKIQRFSGKLSIQAYVDKNKFTTELERKYLDADIKLCSLCEGSKNAKVNGMLVDVLFWAFENPAPGNLIVLSKAAGETLPFSVLDGLDHKGYGVLSAKIRPHMCISSEAEARFLTSLFEGGASSSRGVAYVRSGHSSGRVNQIWVEKKKMLLK